MGMTLKDMIRLVTPPVFIHLAKRLRGNGPADAYGLSGDYHSWDEAVAASTGYDSEIILTKTRDALLKVKNGEAVYERDSVLFDEIQYAWPLLAGLMWVAAQSDGRLNVLDFGGSLGSTYLQNRRFLQQLPFVCWNIIEQPRQVAVGKADFEDEQLRFYGDIADCLAETHPNVIILSGVLQYLERPFDVLQRLVECPCDYLIVDRTPFWEGAQDRLCVQHVPATIYAASYPSWIFSISCFRSFLDKNWGVITEFSSLDRLGAPVETTWKGLIVSRR